MVEKRGRKDMKIAPELGIAFLIAFFVMVVAEALAMFRLPRCDEYCSEDAKKMICLYYKVLGYIESCDG